MKIIGHRGFSQNYPENTLTAFDKAIEARVDAIEMDVRMSVDGKAFIFHDNSLKRTGKAVSLEEQSSGYLEALDIGTRLDPHFKGEKLHFKGEKLLSLKTLLSHIDARTHLILELKYHPATYKKLSKVVAATISDKLSWIEISSFSDDILQLIYKYNSRIRLHKLIDEVEVLERKDFDEVYGFVSYFDISVNLREHPKTKALIRSEKVIFWTVDDEDISASIALGLYGAMSNDPVALKKRI